MEMFSFCCCIAAVLQRKYCQILQQCVIEITKENEGPGIILTSGCKQCDTEMPQCHGHIIDTFGLTSCSSCFPPMNLCPNRGKTNMITP